MEKHDEKSGARALMIASIAVLAISVVVTLVFTLVNGRSAAAPANVDAPETSSSEQHVIAEPSATPDWMIEEQALSVDPVQPAETVPPAPQIPQATEPPAGFVNPFTDVKESDYFYEPLMWAAQNGIVSGETFSPNEICTRAQSLTFLWREEGSMAPGLTVSPFVDVSVSDYFFNPVLWAFEHGLISTPGDGKFNPNDTVDRAQVMTFLYRISEEPETGSMVDPYTDVTGDDYYYNAALWAYNRGIVLLDEVPGPFNGSNPCTRAQFITFLYRCFADHR